MAVIFQLNGPSFGPVLRPAVGPVRSSVNQQLEGASQSAAPEASSVLLGSWTQRVTFDYPLTFSLHRSSTWFQGFFTAWLGRRNPSSGALCGHFSFGLSFEHSVSPPAFLPSWVVFEVLSFHQNSQAKLTWLLLSFLLSRSQSADSSTEAAPYGPCWPESTVVASANLPKDFCFETEPLPIVF